MNPVDLVKAVLEFLKGQPFSNVVALLQLGLLSGAVWVGVFKLVPGERIAIIEGLQRQEDQQTKQIEQVSKSFERALDRFDREHNEQYQHEHGRSSVAAGDP